MNTDNGYNGGGGCYRAGSQRATEDCYVKETNQETSPHVNCIAEDGSKTLGSTSWRAAKLPPPLSPGSSPLACSHPSKPNWSCPLIAPIGCVCSSAPVMFGVIRECPWKVSPRAAHFPVTPLPHAHHMSKLFSLSKNDQLTQLLSQKWERLTIKLSSACVMLPKRRQLTDKMARMFVF